MPRITRHVGRGLGALCVLASRSFECVANSDSKSAKCSSGASCLSRHNTAKTKLPTAMSVSRLSRALYGGRGNRRFYNWSQEFIRFFEGLLRSYSEFVQFVVFLQVTKAEQFTHGAFRSKRPVEGFNGLGWNSCGSLLLLLLLEAFLVLNSRGCRHKDRGLELCDEAIQGAHSLRLNSLLSLLAALSCTFIYGLSNKRAVHLLLPPMKA